ncbi:hypothetical protein SynROS8604_00856 [Synechococcus sp. ROS8604]|nr:hypothetical protein SynROS8604_00856 [Synechococcus sp. ROS8604]
MLFFILRSQKLFLYEPVLSCFLDIVFNATSTGKVEASAFRARKWA